MRLRTKNAWIKALEGGKYEQGTKALRTDDKKYCCLGVLCDITNTKLSKPKSYLLENRGTFELKDLVVLGLSSNQQSKLIRMNDGRGQRHKTFKQIAVWIKKNVHED